LIISMIWNNSNSEQSPNDQAIFSCISVNSQVQALGFYCLHSAKCSFLKKIIQNNYVSDIVIWPYLYMYKKIKRYSWAVFIICWYLFFASQIWLHTQFLLLVHSEWNKTNKKKSRKICVKIINFHCRVFIEHLKLK
jgi:hypothetical protein